MEFSPHFSPSFCCGGGPGRVYFHEKVGIVKHHSVTFQDSPPQRAHLFAPTSAIFCFCDAPPFHFSPLPLFQGGGKVPQLDMGLFRRPVKCRRWGHGEQCAKRFLFGTLLRGPQPATLVLAQFDFIRSPFSKSALPIWVEPACPIILPPSDFAHASIRTLYELL